MEAYTNGKITQSDYLPQGLLINGTMASAWFIIPYINIDRDGIMVYDTYAFITHPLSFYSKNPSLEGKVADFLGQSYILKDKPFKVDEADDDLFEWREDFIKDYTVEYGRHIMGERNISEFLYDEYCQILSVAEQLKTPLVIVHNRGIENNFFSGMVESIFKGFGKRIVKIPDTYQSN